MQLGRRVNTGPPRRPPARAHVLPTPPLPAPSSPQVVSAVMFVVALLAVVGSVQNIIVSWSSYTFFS